MNITTYARQLILGAAAVSLLLAPATDARAQSATPQTGLEVPQIGILKLGTASTVIIVFATDCKACLKALPFYKKLMALPGMDGIERRMNMMTTDGALPGTLVLEANGLTPHHFSSYPNFSLMGVPSVPSTVYVLNAAGQVMGKWEGVLSQGNETEIIAALSAKPLIAK